MKNHSEDQLLSIQQIATETLLACVYRPSRWFRLFESIKGDQNSIMGLPIKEIKKYITSYKND